MSSLCAQLQTDFGQSLLDKEAETSETEPAELSVNAHISNTFNNHIELGLSVDPYTSSLAGQDDPQLSGLISRFGVNLNGDLPIVDKLRFKLQYTPQAENYTRCRRTDSASSTRSAIPYQLNLVSNRLSESTAACRLISDATSPPNLKCL